MAIAPSNLLLTHLREPYRSSLLARMEAVDLPATQGICPASEVPRYAHFMTSGITSVVTFMEDGNGVEVGLIGSEGLVEGMHLLGAESLPTTAFVQVEGTALRMLFADLKKEFLTSENLRTLILADVQARTIVLTQIAACNRLHELEERLARWLLMVSDRVQRPDFYLTQEFLAEMIGVQRTTVTLAAGGLQRSGFILYARGHIQILNRQGLEGVACECYPIVREAIARLYP